MVSRILGHKHFSGVKQLCRTLTLTDTPGTPNLTVSPTFSTPKILGHHKHQFQSNDEDQFTEHTLPFTPIHVNEMISHLEYLSDIREKGNHLNELSL